MSVKGGKFQAPVIKPPPGFVAEPTAAAARSKQTATFTGVLNEDQLAVWRTALELHKKPVRESEGPAPMDISEDDESFQMSELGSEEQGPRVSKKQAINVRQLFMDHCKKISEGISPAGAFNETGMHFKPVIPEEGGIRKLLMDRLKPVKDVFRIAQLRFMADAQKLTAAAKMLPCVVHVSPLCLLLMRDYGPCSRYTDAIRSHVMLMIVASAVSDMDSENNPEHVAMCRKYRLILLRNVNSRFDASLDVVVKNSVSKDVLALNFAALAESHALDRIHVIEWFICDVLRIPFSFRPLLMTPNHTRDAKMLLPEPFSILRDNLCKYTRNRQTVFCDKYVENKDNIMESTGEDSDAWNPMRLDDPPIEDRLGLLSQVPPDHPEATDKYVFGIYGGWISLHTLAEYALFLAEDTRPSARKNQDATKVLTEQEEMGLVDEERARERRARAAKERRARKKK